MARRPHDRTAPVAPQSGDPDYPDAAITGHGTPQDVDANGYAGDRVNDVEDDASPGEILDSAPDDAGYAPLADSEEEEGGAFEGDWLVGQPGVSDPLAALSQVKADDGSFLKAGQKRKFSYDFRDVEDGPPKLDPGTYCAKLVDVDQEDAKSSGLPQWVWQFAITKGPKKGFKIKQWTSLSPNARWKAAQTLKALGVKAAGSMGEWDADDVIGRPVKIEITSDSSYDGTPRSKVQTVHAPDDEAILAAKDVRDLI